MPEAGDLDRRGVGPRLERRGRVTRAGHRRRPRPRRRPIHPVPSSAGCRRVRLVTDQVVRTAAPPEVLAGRPPRSRQAAAHARTADAAVGAVGAGVACSATSSPTTTSRSRPMIGLYNPLAPPVVLEVDDGAVRGHATLGAGVRGPARLRARRDHRRAVRRAPRRRQHHAGRRCDDRHAHDQVPQPDPAAHAAHLRGAVRTRSTAARCSRAARSTPAIGCARRPTASSSRSSSHASSSTRWTTAPGIPARVAGQGP